MGQIDILRGQHCAVGGIAAVLRAVQLDREQVQGVIARDASGKGRGVLDADGPPCLHQRPVGFRPVEVELVVGSGRRHRPGQFGVMPRVRGHGPVGPRGAFRAGPFPQPDLDGRRAARGQVGIREAPGHGIGLVHVAGRRGIRLLPGGHARRIPGCVAVQVGERLARIVFPVGIGIGVGLEPGAVAIGFPDGRVVVGGIPILDAVPDLADGRIRAHHHAIFRSRKHVAVVRRPLDIAPRRFGVQVERLLECVVDGGAVVPVQERAGRDQVITVRQPGPGLAIVVVRMVREGGGIDIGYLPDAQHVGLAGDVAGAAGPDHVPAIPAVPLLAGRADLVAEDGSRRHGRHLRLPPVVGIRRSPRPAALHDARGGVAGLPARPFRPGRAIRGVVDKHPVARHLGRLDVQIQRLAGGIRQGRPELRAAHAVRAVLRPLGIMVNPRDRGRAIPIVAAGRQVGGPVRLADGGDIGFRAGRAELGPGGIHGREFLAPDALYKIRLLIPQVDIVGQRRRIVADVAQGVARGIQVHAPVEPEQHVARRTIHERLETEVGRIGHPRQIDGIGIIRAVGVGEPVGIERGIAVVAILAGHLDRIGQLPVLVNGHGLAAKPAPQGRRIGILVTEDEISAAGHDHRVQRGGVGVEPAAVPGIVVQVGIRAIGAAGLMREADIGGDAARKAAGIIVIQQDQHGDLVAIGAAALAPVHALPGHVVGIAPDAALIAAPELLVAIQQIGHPAIAPLPQEGGVGPARKRAAAFPEGFGMVVAVRVQQPQAGPQEIERVLQFLAGRVIVVMALGMHHAGFGRKAAVAGSVVPRQPVPHAAQAVVQFIAQRIVHQAHAG